MLWWLAHKSVYHQGHVRKEHCFSKHKMDEKPYSRFQGLLKHAMCLPERLLHLVSP